MRFKPKEHVIDLLFSLALFCVFAASSLLVVLIGANVYQNTVNGMDSNNSLRTSLSYINTKVRQNDNANGIQVLQTETGTTALVLEQTLGEKVYQTWIYTQDNSLKEVFVEKGNKVPFESGQKIMDLSELHIEQKQDNLYLVQTVDASGKKAQMLFAVNSNQS